MRRAVICAGLLCFGAVLLTALPVSGDAYSARQAARKLADGDMEAISQLNQEQLHQLVRLLFDAYPPTEPPPEFDGVYINNTSDAEMTITLVGWEIDSTKDGQFNAPSELEGPRVFSNKTVTLAAGTSTYLTDVRPPLLQNGNADPHKGERFYGVGKLRATVKKGAGAAVNILIESQDFQQVITPSVKRHWRRGFLGDHDLNNTTAKEWPQLVLSKSGNVYHANFFGWATSKQSGDAPPVQYAAAQVVIP